jgi:hypothetical protein
MTLYPSLPPLKVAERPSEKRRKLKGPPGTIPIEEAERRQLEQKLHLK